MSLPSLREYGTLGTRSERIVPGRAVHVTGDFADLLADLEAILLDVVQEETPLEGGVVLINRLAEYGWQVARDPDA